MTRNLVSDTGGRLRSLLLRWPVANHNADNNSRDDEKHCGGEQTLNSQITGLTFSIGRIPDVSPQARTDP